MNFDDDMLSRVCKQLDRLKDFKDDENYLAMATITLYGGAF